MFPKIKSNPLFFPCRGQWAVQEKKKKIKYLTSFSVKVAGSFSLIAFIDTLISRVQLWLFAGSKSVFFSWYSFGINSPIFQVANQKNFQNYFVMKSVTVCHFSYEYLQEFLGSEPFCFENLLIFCPSRRFSTYNFIYRIATKVIISEI